MIVDIVLVLLFTLIGGLLGLVVELQKHLYPFYVALLLLLAAGVLDILGKAITPNPEG